MIFRNLSISNFGIYGGDFSFDLSPVTRSNFNRPVVLFRGKNGVGKSTILEAIRLCLHGSLSLGTRVGRAEYVKYLASRIHRPPAARIPPTRTEISLSFDYVRVGQRINVMAKRGWRLAGTGIAEDLTIFEDGVELLDVAAEQRETFLRDLVSPSAADLFFFDSERLHVLAERDASSTLLASSIKSLLGLDAVERLHRDLDVFLTREARATTVGGREADIEAVAVELANAEIERESVSNDIKACQDAMGDVLKRVMLQEQLIAGEGNVFANQLADLRVRESLLMEEIAQQRLNAIERCSGLLPFALAPRICRQVLDRIDAEETQLRSQATEVALQERIDALTLQITTPKFWKEAGITSSPEERRRFADSVVSALRQPSTGSGRPDGEIILHLSDQDRTKLREWLGQAITSVPEEFVAITRDIATKTTEQEDIKDRLRRVPTDDILRPLVEELNRLNQDVGAIRQKEQSFREHQSRLNFRIDQLKSNMSAIRQRIAEGHSSNSRLRMAAQTQIVLEQYSTELMAEKVSMLQRALVSRFNELCRKENFLDDVRMDPVTFSITLYRSGREFDREQLSAGEKQLLATATMWALRDVSRLPIPVIVDTPVGRLDSDHRNTMLHEYFPRASHQVILLSTDAEIDEISLEEMEPYLSHAYSLYYDMKTGSTTVAAQHFGGPVNVQVAVQADIVAEAVA